MPAGTTQITLRRTRLAHRALRVFGLGLLPLSLIACAQEDYTPPNVSCGEEAIGTHRRIDLTIDSPPILGMLKDKEVVLTFDDGPAPGKTNRVLDALANQCATATFFLQGDRAWAHGALVRSIQLAGHSLGAHGWAHNSLMDMSLEDARKDVTRGVDAINKALAEGADTADQRVRLFRFPYVASNPDLDAMVADLGMVAVTVHADGKDWELTAPQDIVDNVMAMLERHNMRGVILLHDPFNSGAAATELLLSRLKEENYRIVAIRGVEAGE